MRDRDSICAHHIVYRYMNVAIIGGGAIGSLLAARLARSECDVALLVRDNEPALRNHIKLIDDTGEHDVSLRIEHDPAKLGQKDLIILAVKAHAIGAALPQAGALLGPDTIIMTAVNGLPWWFFEGQSAAPISMKSVDPGAAIAAALKQQPLVGCVLFPAAHKVAPGIVRHLSGNRIVFGNPRASDDKAEAVAHLFGKAGFETPVAPDIRAALWAKLVGNAAVNPLSVITGATIQHMAEHPHLSAILTSAMAEIDGVGAAINISPMMTQSERLKLAASVGQHKTSMLQDFEAGRPLELSPLLGAVKDIAAWKSIPTPVLDTFHHLIAAKLEEQRGG